MGRHPQSAPNETTLELIGGGLGLDFLNTVDPRHGEVRREYLADYRSLISWAAHAGAIDPSDVASFLADADLHPEAAQSVHREVLELRERASDVFRAIAHGGFPPAESLHHVNEHVARIATKRRLVVRAGSAVWAWNEDERDLERPLWPVVISMAELLTGSERIRECPGDGTCGWLFIDRTKNGSRKWCDMRTCGNRAKARRHYERISGQGPPTVPSDARTGAAWGNGTSI